MCTDRPKQTFAGICLPLAPRREPSPTLGPTVLRCGLHAALCLGLTSCAKQHGDPTSLDGPIFGPSRPTTFVVAPADGYIRARDLARIARVLRRYKTLDAAERALVKSTVSKRLQGLIALEVQLLELKYRAMRQQISRAPDQTVVAKQLAELETAIQREALARVADRLGKLVAVPLKTSDNRSAVAFAKISGTGIEVARDAGEIDRPIASLMDGEGVKSETGGIATVIATPPVPVAPGE